MTLLTSLHAFMLVQGAPTGSRVGAALILLLLLVLLLLVGAAPTGFIIVLEATNHLPLTEFARQMLG